MNSEIIGLARYVVAYTFLGLLFYSCIQSLFFWEKNQKKNLVGWSNMFGENSMIFRMIKENSKSRFNLLLNRLFSAATVIGAAFVICLLAFGHIVLSKDNFLF